MKLFDRENWTRRAVLRGLGWAYGVMIFTEIVNYFSFNYFGFTQSPWRWEVVVIKLVIWTLFGLTFGRWLMLKLEQKK
ncbi:hypothetical protein [uncultured Rikenella sp.]|uniref:hypothetical protein n=1 Tax=uncultured Rikenella sp. TaxID=368003 RepID=UPI0025E8178D|nr:hypothetical protein [uncultured Rikenella sp.]